MGRSGLPGDLGAEEEQIKGETAYLVVTGLAVAGVVATFFRSRAVVIAGALGVSFVAVFCCIGVVSSERLAAVRESNHQMHQREKALEARDIASDWATVSLIGNIGLASAVTVHVLRRKRA